MTPQAEFEGRAVIVTGASRGIGRATARLFAERGASLVLLGRDRATLDTLAAELAGGARAKPAVLAGDLAVSGVAEQAVQVALDGFGRLDIIANVAGVFPTMLLEATTDGAFTSSLETNLGGTFRLCRAAAPALRLQSGGAIVNVSSTAARFPTPGLAVYSASKAAIEALTRALAAELAPDVRVNAVSPGPTLTESVRDLMASDTTGAVAAVTKGLPLQRMGKPEEIAEALLFLASDRASFITGQVLHANGGGLDGMNDPDRSAHDIAQAVERFVRDEVIPYERDPRRSPHGPADELVAELKARARAAGVLTPHVRPDGSHLTQRETALVLRMTGLSPLGPLACNTAAPDEGNIYLLGKVASPELKRRFLEPLVRGEARSAFFMTEPAAEGGAGSDPR